MENTLDFTIDQEDLKCLFIACRNAYKSFDNFIEDSKIQYTNYFNRNTNNLQKYGAPKTYSQWVNGQIIALT
jgi:hypothetical protein